MFYEIGKRSFKILKNLLNLFRVLIVFFTFLLVLYWIFEIAGAKFIGGVAPFFNSIKDFVHIFYNRTTTVDEVQLDYSYLVFSIFLLIISWLLKFVVEFIEDAEKRYDAIYKSFKKKTQELFNIKLEKTYHLLENKNNNFALIIKFSATNLAKDNFYDYNVEEGAEDKQKVALNEFLTEISESLAYKKKELPGGVILFFNKVKNIDKLLFELTKAVELVRAKYKAQKWKVDFLAGIETYSEEKEVMEKCKNLLMLIKLNLKNEILCLSTYKQRYSLVKNQQFFIEAKGVYKIHEEEDVFCIKDKSKHIKHL